MTDWQEGKQTGSPEEKQTDRGTNNRDSIISNCPQHATWILLRGKSQRPYPQKVTSLLVKTAHVKGENSKETLNTEAYKSKE